MRWKNVLIVAVMLLLSNLLIMPTTSQQKKTQPKPLVPVISGLRITSGISLRPGTYRLGDLGGGVLKVTGKDFTIDMKGVKLVGNGQGKGNGIVITDASNVTIKNADVSGYRWGIVLERCEKVKLLDTVSSRNNDLPPGTVIDQSGKEPEDQWGGGILVRDSKECLFQRCVAQYQWDGIDFIRSDKNIVEDGDFSYNGNWGVHFWGSSNNTFRRNRAIWCTTGAGKLFQALTGWSTYDAQAVAIDHNSNENLIEGNDLRFGGDGIFIRANEGPITLGTVVPVKNGSHRNILRNNDCSFSPNNAIEVDFVEDTVIEGNNCSNSNYGLWLGYSLRTIVRNNIAINCSTNAVEIENGQDALIENNTFGFDTPRPDKQLIYLRQNGRDKTPSKGYVLMRNLFYGVNRAVLLANTSAELDGNTLLPSDVAKAVMIDGDEESRWTSRRSEIRMSAPASSIALTPLPSREVVPGSLVTWKLSEVKPGVPPPVIEVDGVPVWVQKIAEGEVTFQIPSDLWYSPAKSEVMIRVFQGHGFTSEQPLALRWSLKAPLIESITPTDAKLGDQIVVTGRNLENGRVLLNGKEVAPTSTTATRIEFKVPNGILTTMRYNLLFERGSEANRIHTPPLPISVQIPEAQHPELVKAEFSPTTLKVGETLKITFTVRNNLPIPARLQTEPNEDFIYDEGKAYWDSKVKEQIDHLHLRVTSDKPGKNQSGSWPYLFAFPKGTLSPEETIVVVGYIRMEQPGIREFRVGLVAGGRRFLADGVFRTKVTVTAP